MSAHTTASVTPARPHPVGEVVLTPTRADGRRIRAELPHRTGIPLVALDLDHLLAPDHPARQVWAVVQRLDLSLFFDGIDALEDGAGRPVKDPHLLVARWLRAMAHGVTSARDLADRCVRDLEFVWRCGGVPLAAHTLRDVRVRYATELRALSKQVPAGVRRAGQVPVVTVAQDGLRVRASAGAGSVPRRATRDKHLATAQAHLAEVAATVGPHPDRQSAARRRGAQDRVRRLTVAVATLPAVEATKPPADKDQARVSETDPAARVMKLPDGGFRPAYNLEVAADTLHQIPVGVSATNHGRDAGEVPRMVEVVRAQCGAVPTTWLADGGFVHRASMDAMETAGSTFLPPVPERPNSSLALYAPHPRDTPAPARWRARMGTAAAPAAYAVRGQTSECVKAHFRERFGAEQLPVRGQTKASMIGVWWAMAESVWDGLRLLGVAGFCAVL